LDRAAVAAGGIAGDRAVLHGHSGPTKDRDAATPESSGVINDGAVLYEEGSVDLMIQDAAALGARVAGQGAILDRSIARVIDRAASVQRGRVAGERAVLHLQRAVIVDAAPLAEIEGGVSGDDAVLHGQVAVVEDSGALGRLSAGDGHPEDASR